MKGRRTGTSNWMKFCIIVLCIISLGIVLLHLYNNELQQILARQQGKDEVHEHYKQEEQEGHEEEDKQQQQQPAQLEATAPTSVAGISTLNGSTSSTSKMKKEEEEEVVLAETETETLADELARSDTRTEDQILDSDKEKKARIPNMQIKKGSNITYPETYNDTNDIRNPLISIAPDEMPLIVEESMYLFYYHRMIRNRHECIQHIRAKHQELLGPILEPILKEQELQQKQQQQQQQQQSKGTSKVVKPSSSIFNVLLVDPSYVHGNVGDHMLALAEVKFIQRLQEQQGYMPIPMEQCNYAQGGPFIQKCTRFLKSQQSSLLLMHKNNNSTTTTRTALWHAGGNWGNLYRWVQDQRIQSFQDLLLAGYDPIISMPQSLYYTKTLGNHENSDTEIIANSIARGLGLIVPPPTKNNNNKTITALQTLTNYTSITQQKIILTWREKSSYIKAGQLYPFATNLLVPDIAFQLGPFNGTEHKVAGRAVVTQVDIILFLRKDKESIYAKVRTNNAMLQAMVNTASQQIQQTKTNKTSTTTNAGSNNNNNNNNLTFAVYDWSSRYDYFTNESHYFTRSIIKMMSSGKVLIADRLHASILSYLSGIPLILLDNVSKKINQTLEVAFDTWEGCQDNDHGMYASATNLPNAINLAVQFIDKYHL